VSGVDRAFQPHSDMPAATFSAKAAAKAALEAGEEPPKKKKKVLLALPLHL
jgi:hypothetical protein